MKQAIQLDEIDRRLLRALQVDASQSLAFLSENAGASTTSCWRRIRALELAKVLGPTVRLVAAERVDRSVNVMCQLRMKSHENAERQKFETFLQTRGEVMEAYSMSGAWDYLLRIVVSDVADYQRFLMGPLLNHPAVDAASSHFALSQVKYTTALPV